MKKEIKTHDEGNLCHSNNNMNLNKKLIEFILTQKL